MTEEKKIYKPLVLIKQTIVGIKDGQAVSVEAYAAALRMPVQALDSEERPMTEFIIAARTPEIVQQVACDMMGWEESHEPLDKSVIPKMLITHFDSLIIDEEL